MKIIITILLTAVLVFALSACGDRGVSQEEFDKLQQELDELRGQSTAETTTETEPKDINQVIEDFLMQFPTIFGGNPPSGSQADAIWLLDGEIATDFTLWDFDNDGIPEILIYYGENRENASLFKFVEGEYKRVSRVAEQADHVETSDNVWLYHWNNGLAYYLDENENLIAFVALNGGEGYSKIDFEDNNTSFSFELIAYHNARGDANEYVPSGLNLDEWLALFNKSGNWVDGAFVPVAHNLPNTNTLLTPIEPLTALQNEIETAVRQRLQDSGISFQTAPPQISTTTVVPNLVGLTDRDLALGGHQGEHRITIRHHREESLDADFDKILRQNPAPGTVVNEWDIVDIWLGAGSSTPNMPFNPNDYDENGILISPPQQTNPPQQQEILIHEDENVRIFYTGVRYGTCSANYFATVSIDLVVENLSPDRIEVIAPLSNRGAINGDEFSFNLYNRFVNRNEKKSTSLTTTTSHSSRLPQAGVFGVDDIRSIIIPNLRISSYESVQVGEEDRRSFTPYSIEPYSISIR
jgi:hypothetical protein